MQNTPAPWTAAAYPDQYRVDGHNGQIVLIIRDGLIPMREDGRLIAAAPLMLATLQAVLKLATMPAPLREDVEHAIARATGEA
jgi:hypothetical protein